MADRVTKVAFLADVTNFNKGLAEAQGKTQSFAQKIDAAAGKAKLVLAGLGAAGLIAAKGAAEDEAAATKLATTLQNVTKATDAQIASTEKYIGNLALATGVADDQLRPSLDRLVRSTGDVTEAQKLQALALDVSAGTGKSLEAVTEALAKANEGSFTSLKKLGIPLDENIIKTKDFQAAQKILADTFEGQSAKAAETNAGKMQRLQVAMSEAQETLGYALLPVLGEFVDALQVVAPWIQENQDLIGKAVIVVGGLAAVVVAADFAIKAWTVTTRVASAVAGAFRLVQLTVAAATGSATAAQTLAEMTYKRSTAATIAYNIAEKTRAAGTAVVTAAQWALNAAMTANPIGIVVVAIGALVAALVVAYNKSETFRNIVNGAFNAIKERIGGVVNFMREAVPAAFQAVLNFIKGIPGAFVNIGKGIFNALTAPYRTAFSYIAKAWNATVGKLSFKAPDWVPGIGGKGWSMPTLPENIPALAKGGIVNRPTLALIGEAGPEAVVPLSRGRGMGNTYNITISGALLDPEAAARQIVRAIKNSELRAGAFA